VINPDFVLLFSTTLNTIQIRNVIKITDNSGIITSSGITESKLFDNKKIIGNIENNIGCNSGVLVIVFIITIHPFP